MAKLICALTVVVLLGIMFPSGDSITFGVRIRRGRGLGRSKIYNPNAVHFTGINHNGTDNRYEVADGLNYRQVLHWRLRRLQRHRL